MTDKRKLIQNLHFYEMNYCMEFNAEANTFNPLSCYLQLNTISPMPFSTFSRFGNIFLICASPERFLKKHGHEIISQPIKGTIRRSFDKLEDEYLAKSLYTSEKERAENLMIVDLLRNDLARVTQAGSVSVDHLFQVEHYPTLNTMTSTISGTLQADQGLADIMGALFPCGSVTGAPKKRAMEIIHELEAGPRGPYTGAIGVLNPDGTFSFNVAIRTPIVFPGGEGRIGLGSGIVADSNAQSEYEECHLKGRFLTDPRPAFDLFETTVWRPDSGFLLLEAHLQRGELRAARARQPG